MTTRGVVRLVAAILIFGALHGRAQAQAAAAQEPRGYAEGFAQSAFGNVTSQAYGGEFGVTVWQNMQAFVEAGQVSNVATESLSTNAALIAGALGQLQPGAVSYDVNQPVTFFAGGVRLPIVRQGTRLRPYVQGGFGVANVKNDVSYTISGGADASQYVTLGEDLTGSHTSPMLTFGGGLVVPVWQQLIADVQFRFNRIFAADEGINIGRVGIGLGVRF